MNVPAFLRIFSPALVKEDVRDHTDKVQRFIDKNRNHLSVGITIDGTKRKHDLNRIRKKQDPLTAPPCEGGEKLPIGGKHRADTIYSPPSQGGAGEGSERGSYDDVVKNIPLWLEQFPGAATKVTIASADIPYIKESVLHLYS